MLYRAVIFDLDGTLLDTLEDLADATNHALDSLGFPTHDPDLYKNFLGCGITALVCRALPENHRDETTIQICIDRVRQEYHEHWAEKTHPFEGIPELLDRLQDMKLILNILTNKPDNFTRMTVERFLFKWRFANVLGIKPGLNRKPDPQGALQIIKECGLAPEDFLYLGDSDTDMLTARDAGIIPIGALWGYRTREELIEAGAESVIEKPAELLQFFEERNDDEK